MKSDAAKLIGGALVVLIIIGVVIWMKAAVWSECRSFDHSFLYCLNQMSR